jgi:hypothetical protein
MGADGLFDTGVVKQRPQLFGDKVDKNSASNCSSSRSKWVFAVLAELVAQRSRCAGLSSISLMMGLSP